MAEAETATRPETMGTRRGRVAEAAEEPLRVLIEDFGDTVRPYHLDALKDALRVVEALADPA